ncbi:MAG: alkaline phosphatase family protein [Betaproteobacteria bacterium]|nr:alkaline phosphatase family protein [Betaproteobacteria bacterium]
MNVTERLFLPVPDNRADELRPDYGGGSLVNLTASLSLALGGEALPYPPLRVADVCAWKQARHVVLLVIDGLGLRHLEREAAGGHLHGHLVASLTSVFPSTTASAVTTLLTGLAPQQHGLTGWHMYFREIGAVVAPLPLRARYGGPPLPCSGVAPESLLLRAPIFDRFPLPAHVISPASIADSEFTILHAGRARRIAYGRMDEMFRIIAEVARSPRAARSFSYAYWPDLDAAAHVHGVDSKPVRELLFRLDEAFGCLLKSIGGTDSLVLVTADHGFVDSPPERRIDLANCPELSGMLRMPLCGERRLAYCYVKPECFGEFAQAADAQLGGTATILRSADLIDDGWFGPGTPHPRLHERVGDFTLIMKPGWTIRDTVPGERNFVQVGVHGGITADEMMVPLISATA